MPENEDRRRRRKLILLIFGWLVAAGGLTLAVADLESGSPLIARGGTPTNGPGRGARPSTSVPAGRANPAPADDDTATKDFSISGSVAQLFAPGVSRPVNLVIGNTHNFTIRVTGVTITVSPATSRPGCSGTANLKVTKSLTAPVDVPGNATRTLEQLGVAQAAWPVLTMPNLPTNQDACKNAVFSLAYTGQAVRP